jgi:hypothetical protein
MSERAALHSRLAVAGRTLTTLIVALTSSLMVLGVDLHLTSVRAANASSASQIGGRDATIVVHPASAVGGHRHPASPRSAIHPDANQPATEHRAVSLAASTVARPRVARYPGVSGPPYAARAP